MSWLQPLFWNHPQCRFQVKVALLETLQLVGIMWVLLCGKQALLQMWKDKSSKEIDWLLLGKDMIIQMPVCCFWMNKQTVATQKWLLSAGHLDYFSQQWSINSLLDLFISLLQFWVEQYLLEMFNHGTNRILWLVTIELHPSTNPVYKKGSDLNLTTLLEPSPISLPSRGCHLLKPLHLVGRTWSFLHQCSLKNKILPQLQKVMARTQIKSWSYSQSSFYFGSGEILAFASCLIPFHLPTVEVPSTVWCSGMWMVVFDSIANCLRGYCCTRLLWNIKTPLRIWFNNPSSIPLSSFQPWPVARALHLGRVIQSPKDHCFPL